jgi:DNA-binding NarL/FixJ family response regulator
MAEASTKQFRRLTGREQQVAALVCNGLSNKSVAQRLNVSEGTVKIHLHSIFKKLGVHGRSALAVALLDVVSVFSEKLS